MSTDLAVTAVTRTIRQILEDGIVTTWASELHKEFVATMLLPSKVRENFAAKNVVNVYLYRTDINAAWRNQPLPSATKPGETGPAPLALNLEYLITAYGEDEREDAAQFFLGQAMRVLHDRAILPRAKFKSVLPDANVQEQIEQVTITPKPLSIEELSKLWSVLAAPFRVSATYLVTVVLIDSHSATRSPQPVLTRGVDDTGFPAVTGAPPVLDSARAASGFPAVRLDEVLNITGQRLDGGGLTARFRHPLAMSLPDQPVTPVSATQVGVKLPAAQAGSGVSAAWPAGAYALSLVVTRPQLPVWTTNSVPFVLAPSIDVAPAAHAKGAPFEVTITATPQVRDGQPVIVIWDGTQLAPKSVTTAAGDDSPTIVTFDAPGNVEGKHMVRLRVDGVDSVPVRDANGKAQFATVEVTP